MMMFRLRSSCRSSRSTSMPFISGISTSRMIRSGRSPSLTLASTSLPEPIVSTSKPSTSRSVCKYFRILGSSSTTKIFSLTAIAHFSLGPLRLQPLPISKENRSLNLIHGQQKCELAPLCPITLHPYFAAMRLHQTFRDRQTQTHTRSVAIDPHEVLENLLMMLWGDSRSAVRHRHFHAVWPGQSETPALLCR